MKIFKYDPQLGRPITQYGSNFLMSGIAMPNENIHVGCMSLPAQGLVGYHQTTQPQLFILIQGEGWVRGESEERVAVQAGSVAFWDKGEWHEAGTDTGMNAIVIETPVLDAAQIPNIGNER